MARSHSYTPTSKPVFPNPKRTFAINGPSKGTRPDDVPTRAGFAGKAMLGKRGQVNQQAGAPKGKTT